MQKYDNENIFITESSNGEHHKVSDKFKADVVSFTFIANISIVFSLTDFSSLLPKITKVVLNGEKIEIDSLSSLFANKKRVFIGMDLDIEGCTMARILKDYAKRNHFEDNQIYRIPLTSHGFEYLGTFMSDSDMLEVLKNKQDEMEFMQKNKSIFGVSVSRRDVLLMNEMETPPESVLNINKEGTSSITYIFKKSINEK